MRGYQSRKHLEKQQESAQIIQRYLFLFYSVCQKYKRPFVCTSKSSSERRKECTRASFSEMVSVSKHIILLHSFEQCLGSKLWLHSRL